MSQKFTKREQHRLEEYLSMCDKNGILTVDNWTSGSGRYTRNRALPPFVKSYSRDQFNFYSPGTWPKNNTLEREALDFFRDNARRKRVLILDQQAFWNFLMENAHMKEF